MKKFLTDRMLGTLTRYLRFMGYDTVTANQYAQGNTKEDTLLLSRARTEGRILLTRDAELARRGGDRAVLIHSEEVVAQVDQLVELGLIERRLPMSRCSLCNSPLREARDEEVSGALYAPDEKTDLEFFWCDECKKLYWNGSHGRRLLERIGGR